MLRFTSVNFDTMETYLKCLVFFKFLNLSPGVGLFGGTGMGGLGSHGNNRSSEV